MRFLPEKGSHVVVFGIMTANDILAYSQRQNIGLEPRVLSCGIMTQSILESPSPISCEMYLACFVFFYTALLANGLQLVLE